MKLLVPQTVTVKVGPGYSWSYQWILERGQHRGFCK